MPTTCPVRCPLLALVGPAPAARYTYIDAFNGKTVTRKTHLSYTVKCLFVNMLIRGNVWKTWEGKSTYGSGGRRGNGVFACSGGSEPWHYFL